jgi:hypothetical protein
MFSITQNDIRKAGKAGMAELLSGFDADTEVWEGDARDLLIGDSSDMDDDDAAQYRLIGTCGELAQQYRDLIEAA